ncbi:MAG TPA: VOC family protein [Thermoanaerobaculia bacterium]|nr:VOC family protein [Thermoanaerobaculia bacterium]
MTKIGTISWIDLAVPDADAVRDFYRDVAGWTTSDVDMGGYNDYCMIPPGEDAPVAGICHARGVNAALPPQWMIYINVADLDQSMEACTAKGGSIVLGPKSMGDGSRYCVIKDPAGAVAALFQPAK